MTRWQRIVLIGSIVVLCYEVAASFGAQAFGFPYYRVFYGTWFIYACVAFVAGRAMNSVGSAALAAGLVGLVEATVGWAISWWVGPGRLGNESMTATGAAMTVAMVVLLAGVIGAVVGLIVRQRSFRTKPSV